MVSYACINTVTINEIKEAIDWKESREKYTEGYGERKVKGEIIIILKRERSIII